MSYASGSETVTAVTRNWNSVSQAWHCQWQLITKKTTSSSRASQPLCHRDGLDLRRCPPSRHTGNKANPGAMISFDYNDIRNLKFKFLKKLEITPVRTIVTSRNLN